MNWSFLESLPGLIAVPCVWSEHLAADYHPFKALCLQPDDWQVESYPCPRKCGCWHRVILRHDGTGALGACQCSPPACPDIPLSRSDITPLKLNWSKLARELSRALTLPAKFIELPLPDTVQIGSWSADPVPAILTIQTEYDELTSVIAELGMRLQKQFILLSPTANLLTAPSHELLAHAHAGFFTLDSTVTLTAHGTLAATKPPGVLFARFTPQPKEIDEDIAARVLALVGQFDAATINVFRLYCVEGLSASQVALQSRSSKTAVMRRLKIIHDKTGIAPAQMRRLSPHLDKIADASTDPRAARIHRKRFIYDEEENTDTNG